MIAYPRKIRIAIEGTVLRDLFRAIDKVDGEDVLPGFALRLASIFS